VHVFTIDALFVNQVPTFELANQTITVFEDQGWSVESGGVFNRSGFAYNITPGPRHIFDEMQQIVTFTTEISGNGASLFAIQPRIHQNGTLEFETALDRNGVAEFVVTLHDSGGVDLGGANRSQSYRFQIFVAAVNDLPMFQLPCPAIISVFQYSGLTSMSFATNLSSGPSDELDQTFTFVVDMVSEDPPNLFDTYPSISPEGIISFSDSNVPGFASIRITLYDYLPISMSNITSQDGSCSSNQSVFPCDTGCKSRIQFAAINIMPSNKAPSFRLVMPATLWQISESDGPRLRTITDFEGPSPCFAIDTSYNISLLLLKGSSEFVLPFAANLSSGHLAEVHQARTFVLTTLSGDPTMFEEAPQVTPEGILRMRVSPVASGQVLCSVTLVDTDDFRGNSSSDSVSLSIVISPAYIQFTLSLEHVPENSCSLSRDIQEQIAKQLNVHLSSVYISPLSGLGAGVRRLLAASYTVIIRTASIADAVRLHERLEFVPFFDFSTIVDGERINPNVQEVTAWSFTSARIDSEFSIESVLVVDSTLEHQVFEHFAYNVTVGTEVQLTSSNLQIWTFKPLDIVNPSIFARLPEMTPSGTLSFRLAESRPGVADITIGLFTYSDTIHVATRNFSVVATTPNIMPSFILPWIARCIGTQNNDCQCFDYAFPEKSRDCHSVLNFFEKKIHSEVAVLGDSGKHTVKKFAVGVSPARNYSFAGKAMFNFDVDENLENVRMEQDSMLFSAGKYAQAVVSDITATHYYAAEFSSDSLLIMASDRKPNPELLFVDRRREAEIRLRFLLDDNVDLSACSSETFTMNSSLYVFISRGCNLHRYNKDVLPLKNIQTQDVPSTDCIDQSTTEACLALREAAAGEIWNSTFGFWDFTTENAGGTFERARMDGRFCQEINPLLIVSPAKIKDLSGRAGDAVLQGPACKAQSDWDTSNGIAFNVNNFMISNGEVEAMQFDGAINFGLQVAQNIAVLEKPTARISVESWVTIDATRIAFGGIVGAAQSGGGLFRGWTLGYSVEEQGALTVFYWSLSVEQADKRNTLRYECKRPMCDQGQWVHIVVTYDGKNSSISLDGRVVAQAQLCEFDTCGGILYPTSATPLVIGAYNNVISGKIQGHVGSIKMLRIYSMALDAETIYRKSRVYVSLYTSAVSDKTFWVAQTWPASPSLTSAHVSSSTHIQVLGMFQYGGVYRCEFKNGNETAVSASAVLSECAGDMCFKLEILVPSWRFGHKAAHMGIQEKKAGSWNSVWQRACMRAGCGYVPPLVRPSSVPAFLQEGVRNVTGNLVKFTFTMPSALYRLDEATRQLQVTHSISSVFGAAGSHYFVQDDRHFLLVANYWDGQKTTANSAVYELDPSTGSATLIQELPTDGASAWTECTVEGGDYARVFVMASFSGTTTVFGFSLSSGILLHEEQIILTPGAASVECFDFVNKSLRTTMLAVSQFFNKSSLSHTAHSEVFRWENNKFQPFQKLPTVGGRHANKFVIDGNVFLLQMSEMGPVSTLYRFDADVNRFAVYQHFETAYATSSTLLGTDEGNFLFITQSQDCLTFRTGQHGACSFMYKWNGTHFNGITETSTAFSQVDGGQAFSTHSAQHVTWARPTSSQEPILFISNFEGQQDGTKHQEVQFNIYVPIIERLDNALRGPTSVAVMSDGIHVYVAAEVSRAITTFARDGETGLLVHLADSSLDIPISMGIVKTIIASDTQTGTCLYALAEFPGAIHVFARNASSGSLEWIQTVTEDISSSVKLIDSLSGATSLAISSDNSSVFVSSCSDSAVSEFDRSVQSGTLEYVDRIRAGERIVSEFNFTPRQLVDESQYLGYSYSGVHFEVDSTHHLVVAAGGNGARMCVWRIQEEIFAHCQLLSWVNGQGVSAYDTSAFDVQYHQLKADALVSHLIFVTNYGNESVPTPPCSVYRWDSVQKTLVLHQHLHGKDATLAYAGKASVLEIDDLGMFLAVAITSNATTYETSSLIFKWDSSQSKFNLLQEIATTAAVAVKAMNFQADPAFLFSNQFEYEPNVYQRSANFDLIGGNEPACGRRFMVWRVQEVHGYGRLGDTMVRCTPGDSTCQPSSPAYQLRIGTWLVRPKRFSLILSDFAASAQGTSWKLSMWRPVAPAGFVCLGDVAHDSDATPPNTDHMYCVRKDLLNRLDRPKVSTWWNEGCLIQANPPYTDNSLFEKPGASAFIGLNATIEYPADMEFWDLRRPLSDSADVPMAHAATSAYRYNYSNGIFVKSQTLPSVGAYDLEIFSIGSRRFIVIANKQSHAPIVYGDESVFDQESVMYEWVQNGLVHEFVEFQRFAGQTFGSVPEDYCAHPDANCQCNDDPDFGLNFYGPCETYEVGGLNHGLCATDDACGYCSMSCSSDESCGLDMPCKDVSAELHFLRRASNWEQVPILRGASGFTHFDVEGEHFLAVAQSTCKPGQSTHSCDETTRVHSQSAVLQWDGVRFGHILSASPSSVQKIHRHVHDYALRLAVGAAFKWLFLELPTKTSIARYLVAFSLTSRVPMVRWSFKEVINMKCAVAVAVTPDQASVYVVSDVDHALARIDRGAVIDLLGRSVTMLSLAHTWEEGKDGVKGLHGANRIEIFKQQIVVYSGLRQHERLCGVPLLRDRVINHAESGIQDVVSDMFSWQNSVYSTGCQEFNFSVEYEGGDPSLLVELPRVTPDGTLMFELAPLKFGTVLYRVFMQDMATNPKQSNPEYFAIQVSEINHAPTFNIRNVTVDEDTGVHELEFAFDLSPGPETERYQNMHWKFTLSNEELFSEPPRLVVEGGEGGVGKVFFKTASNATGVSSVFVTLKDSGGTIPAKFVPITKEIGRDESDVQVFTIEVKPKNDAPYFQMQQKIEVAAGTGFTMIDHFSFNVMAGPANEAAQNLTFVLTAVVDAGTLFAPELFFSQLPQMDLDGKLTFAPAPRVSGTVLFTFTLFDSGGFGIDERNSFSRSARLSVESVNNAPSFNLPASTIQVASFAYPLTYHEIVVANISKGAIDEDFMQEITFVVRQVSNDALFLQLPTFDVDGTIFFVVAPGSQGNSTVQFFITDDGGIEFGGEDTSEIGELTIEILKTNVAPAFNLLAVIVMVVEDTGLYTQTGFVHNISKGTPDEANQALFFNITLMSLSPNLFEIEPFVDDQGTLSFRSEQGAYGSATASIKLTDSGGTANGGIDQTVCCASLCLFFCCIFVVII